MYYDSMKKKIPSRHPNASAQRPSNFKAAPSKSFVKKKSKKLNGDGLLKIATPKDSALQFLRDEGLIAPDEIPSNEDAVPLNFTRLDSRQLGAMHSRYAVRHSHAIYVVSRYAFRLATLRAGQRVDAAKFRFRYSDDYKRKYELDAALSMNKRYRKREDEILTLEAKVDVLNAVAASYEDLRNAASREMYRRGSEQAPKD